MDGMQPVTFDEPLIRSITDTARWVAYHRANESDRADALFHDPFARRLAGDRGARIGRAMDGNARFIALRTAMFDAVLAGEIAQASIQMVVNLAAGLDTRPYRLSLPPALRWVEVDLPEITDFKRRELAGETTQCVLETLSHDLADLPGRRRLFAELNARSLNTLVMSEGLLTYLTEEQVAELCADLRAQQNFRYWAVEVVSSQIVETVKRTWGISMEAAGSSFEFAPRNWRRFYARHGWRLVRFEDMEQYETRCGRAAMAATRPTGAWDRLFNLAKDRLLGADRGARWESGVALLTRA